MKQMQLKQQLLTTQLCFAYETCPAWQVLSKPFIMLLATIFRQQSTRISNTIKAKSMQEVDGYAALNGGKFKGLKFTDPATVKGEGFSGWNI